MNWEVFTDIVKDAFSDSLSVFVFVFAFHMLISFVEDRMARFLATKGKVSPVIGSAFGLIPQCGTSVLGSDLYVRGFITSGTLIAVFLSCSDEALIILMTKGRWLPVVSLLGLKFVIAGICGLAADFFIKEKLERTYTEYEGHAHSETWVGNHILHPLHHSLSILVYVFAVNLLLGVVIGLTGEENLSAVFNGTKYLAPFLAPVIGLIPNCASSVLLTELFIDGSLSFGALTGGLLVNSGLGVLILFRKKNTIRSAVRIMAICFAVSVVSGYLICLFTGF